MKNFTVLMALLFCTFSVLFAQEQTDPVISVFPDTFDVIVPSGSTLDTTMTIYNSGVDPLNFSIAPAQPVKKGMLPDEVTGEEIFGGIGTTWSGGARTRGNIFHVTTATTLLEHKMFLNITVSTDMVFFVYEGTTITGIYNKIDEVLIPSSGTGQQFYSSGPINVPLEVGKYYYIGAGWNASVTYYRGTTATPIPASFGTLETGIPGEIAGGYPPAPTANNTYNTGQFPPYYCAIVTGVGIAWITANPDTGQIAAGDSMEIDVNFDPSGLLGGDYYANLMISSDDPVTPELPVGVHMFVAADGDIDFQPSSIVFDTTFVGGTSAMTGHVLNNGVGVLDISDITFTNPVFSVDTSIFTVPPLDSFEVNVSYNPTTAGQHDGWMLIHSNDPDTPIDSVAISGIAADAPVANITPSFANPVHVLPDDSTDVSISILNSAGPTGAKLIWSAAASNEPATPTAFRPTPTGKPTVSDAVEASPNVTPLPAAWIEAPFDLQFSYDVTAITGAAGNAGTEFDEVSFYTTRWASNLLHEITTAGTLVREFSVTGVTGLRDLAYDGAFFYGGAAATTIYQMDFSTTPGTLIGTITSPVPVRYIAYDEGADAFWVGNWDTPPTLVSRSGTNLGSITSGVTSQYGAAYDSYTDGGPYLWIYDQGAGAGSPQFIHQIDIASGVPTGVTFDVKSVVGGGDPNAIAGGLWISEGIEPGLATIGGLQQGVPDMLFGLELTQTAPAWIQLLGATSGSLDPGDQYDLMVRLYGITERDTAYVNITTNDPTLPGGIASILVVIDTTVVGLGDLEQMPRTFAISQNYPNPFNPSTTFSYQLPRQSNVKLVIYNVLGQKVRTLINGQVEAGYHTAVWDGGNEKGIQAASGIYVYRFEAGQYVKTMKMMLLK